MKGANQIQLALFVSAEGTTLIVENGSCEFQATRIDVFIAFYSILKRKMCHLEGTNDKDIPQTMIPLAYNPTAPKSTGSLSRTQSHISWEKTRQAHVASILDMKF